MRVLNKTFNFKEGETLLFNKPLAWTSFDLIKKIRNIIKLSKIGHAGTLDPLATGLMIICTGSNTKKINGFQEMQKEYTGSMMIGATTPSYDLETEIDKTFDYKNISEEAVLSAVKKFTGAIKQCPPPYSAVKIKGERAYNKARRGESFLITQKDVEIHEFEITNINLPEISFRVVCSKGTYIRSLVHDFGKELHNGAHLVSLCRTRIGDFLLKDAWEINDFEAVLKIKHQILHDEK